VAFCVTVLKKMWCAPAIDDKGEAETEERGRVCHQLCVFACHCDKGGILLAANLRIFQLQNPSLTSHTVSTSILDLRDNSTWVITGVYGPKGDLEKKMFIREFKLLKSQSLLK
jgi:hypothetical protein